MISTSRAGAGRHQVLAVGCWTFLEVGLILVHDEETLSRSVVSRPARTMPCRLS
jgi:hypothetical protein